MKAVLALIFFACVAGSMADARLQGFQDIVVQAENLLSSIVGQLQTQVSGLVQQVFGQLQSVVSSLGARFDFSQLLQPVLAIVAAQAQQLLGHVTAGLAGLIGGRGAFDNVGAIFNDFVNGVLPALQGLGQHFLNQGLSAVLGAIGGARFIGGLFDSLSQQFQSVVAIAQGAVQGVVGNLSQIGAQILDASKPHLQQLQEQLVGHGLNVLGSLSETINNLHGSITGSR
ncbi:unnamed protein product [Rotaria sp. Silwood1]|nr:unnamed protein product [Rotaria sp. Silwood1]